MTTMPSNPADTVRMATEVAERLRRARSVAVLTGAGMSAESGIPTFRGGDNSLWRDFDPETLATPEGFRRDPALVWAWYHWRTGLVAQAQPHVGHRALAQLEARLPALDVITQNVDNLHERAGSRRVVHLHGSMFALRCFACARPHDETTATSKTTASATDATFASANAEPTLRLEPPRCDHCGGRIRPGVVWFGEALPDAPWQQSLRNVREAELLLVVGTAGVVQPAASLVMEARQAGAFVVEINPAGTEQTRLANLAWRATAADALGAVINSFTDPNHH
jgi:NAD-dependent deacetylase